MWSEIHNRVRPTLRQFFGSRTNSTFTWYSPEFYYFSVLTRILPFSGTRWDSFSIVVRILQFSDTRPDSPIFQYSYWFYPFPVLARIVFTVLGRILPFPSTSSDSTIFMYSHGFYPISVFARQFLGSRTDSTFTRYSPDSIIFQYSHGFYPFSVLARIVFRYLQGLYLFLVLPRILPFLGTCPDSANFGTHTDSTLFRYSP